MKTVVSWIRVLNSVVQYVAYRAKLRSCPNFLHIREETERVVGQVLHWRRRMRVVHPERCPRSGPVAFAGNHCFMEDPFVTYHATAGLSNQAIKLHPMMREGVFASSKIFNSRLFDMDEFATLFGVMNISRDNVKLSQLKPFIKVLRERGAILIYPTRTRTRTGAIVEFPEGFDEPGGVSFFVTQAQKADADLRVTVSPVTRSDNLVNDVVTLVFGEPMYLDTNASREEQREFDFRLLQAVAEGVALTVPHVVSTVLYLRCLHGLPDTYGVEELVRDVSAVFAKLQGRVFEESANDVPREVRRTLKWLAKREMLTLQDERFTVNRAAILAAPPHDREYKRKNPVKYHANQILHLADVVSAVEDVVLSPSSVATRAF